MENYGILIVDGEVAYHAILSSLLEAAGRPLDAVQTLDAAIDAVERSHPALVLLDIALCADAAASTARLREAARAGGTCAIIAMSDGSGGLDAAHCRAAGFDGYLAKPFTAADVDRLIGRWLNLETPARETAGGRLIALLGEEVAGEMIDRLFASLGEALDAIDAGADPAPFGHRLGGLAGTLGFPVLSAAWLALQGGGTRSWPTVRCLSAEAIARQRDGGAA